MIQTQKRRKLCMLLMILNIVFIWGHSLLTREISAAFSKLVGSILSLFFSGPMTPAEGQGHGILRKIAHFTEFCTLGMLVSWHVRLLDLKTWSCFALPVLSGVVIAFVDESIQFFIPGRGPGLLDVAIDSAGALLGTLVIALAFFLRSRKKKENSLTQCP